jgi:uncharacterized CHY-type Zn-finger protein
MIGYEELKRESLQKMTLVQLKMKGLALNIQGIHSMNKPALIENIIINLKSHDDYIFVSKIEYFDYEGYFGDKVYSELISIGNSLSIPDTDETTLVKKISLAMYSHWGRLSYKSIKELQGLSRELFPEKEKIQLSKEGLVARIMLFHINNNQYDLAYQFLEVELSDELCLFLNKPVKTKMLKNILTEDIKRYIWNHQLYDTITKQIIPNPPLQELLKIGLGDTINFFHLFKLLEKHTIFDKKNETSRFFSKEPGGIEKLKVSSKSKVCPKVALDSFHLPLKVEKSDKNLEKLSNEKKKKQTIPKNVRVIVWNNYIGEDIIKHKCLCCKKVTIRNTEFEVGHVESEKNGGTHEINNLRPICGACNHSMGTENMVDYVKKYGLYIG